MSPFDAIAAEVLADEVFDCGTRDAIIDDDDTFDDAHADEGDRYVARMALDDAESEARFVEDLNERRERVARGHEDDPAAVASLQRLAREAWTHERYARAAAARADWDPVVRPLAALVVRRAQRAASAIARAAARAVTRAAIRARNSARARISAPARLSHVCRPARRSCRSRAPHARRVRVSAVSSAGSGRDEPSPEPEQTAAPPERERALNDVPQNDVSPAAGAVLSCAVADISAMHRTPAEPSDAAPWAPPASVRGSPDGAGDVQDTVASVPAPDARDAGAPLGEAPGDGADRSDLDRLTRALKQAGIPGNTQKIYRSRFALFVPWCAARGVPAMPVSPELLWQYLVALADENKSVSTVKVSLAAINKAHQVFGHTPPRSEQIRAMIRELERTADRPKAIDLTTLKRIVAGCPHDAAGTRDRALLLGKYHGRLRRAQSAGLDLQDVQRETDRYLVRVSKGGKEGARVGLSSQPDLDLCPVHAMDEWLLLRSKLAPGADPSALFVALHPGGRGNPPKIGQRISPEDVDRIFKRRAMAAGLDPASVSATDLRADGCAGAARRLDDPIRGLKCE